MGDPNCLMVVSDRPPWTPGGIPEYFVDFDGNSITGVKCTGEFRNPPAYETLDQMGGRNDRFYVVRCE